MTPMFPGYEILAEVGRGSVGVVYKARLIPLDRVVALKMLAAGRNATSTELQRFRCEAQALAGLQHPNVVSIYEVGEYDGRAYISMEYCPGGDLAAALNGRPLTPPHAARIVETLTGVVEYLHQRGILHRDLKLADVLLAGPTELALEQGSVKLCDFGLARLMTTPPAPGGAWVRVSGPPTDVFGLGCILYELLTGRTPFVTPSPFDVLFRGLIVPPVPPSQLQPGVPAALEQICLKCLAAEPGDRFPSARQFADELQRFRQAAPASASPSRP
jgi:serine/threonine-protein kinase